MKKFSIVVFCALALNTLAQGQNVGIDNADPKQKLDVAGAIKIGNTTADETGSIRFNGTNFQGYDGATWKNLDATGGSGTVTSVALGLPNIFSVSGSPVTTTGTLTAALASQNQNLVFASPNGSSGTPSFRALVAADIPNLDAGKITTGTFAVARIPAGSDHYIRNTTTQQAGANFNIGGNGTVGGTLSVSSTATTGGISATAIATGGNVIQRSGGGANWFPWTDGNNYISSNLTRIRTTAPANTTIADFTGTGVTIPVGANISSGLTVSGGLNASNGSNLSGGLTVSGTTTLNNALNANGVSDFNARTRVVDAQFWLSNAAGDAISTGIGTSTSGHLLVLNANGRVARRQTTSTGPFNRTNSTWTTISSSSNSNVCFLVSQTSQTTTCEQRIDSGNIQVRNSNASGTCTWRCIEW